VVANNGKEGVDIVSSRMQNNEKPFDLILMDIHMPVMDGLVAASIITELEVETPIIALTANIMSHDLELYREIGIQDYLGKPFTSQELWNTLIKYLKVESYTEINSAQLLVDDDKIKRKLQAYFIKYKQSSCDEIVKAVEAGDLKLAHRMAHTLKSIAGQVGEKGLQDAAGAVESMLADEACTPCYETLSAMETEFALALENLSSRLSDSVTDDAPETGDMEKVWDVIGKLESLLVNSRPECMDLLDDIRMLPSSGELARLVEEFEFESAITELNKIKEQIGKIL